MTFPSIDNGGLADVADRHRRLERFYHVLLFVKREDRTLRIPPRHVVPPPPLSVSLSVSLAFLNLDTLFLASPYGNTRYPFFLPNLVVALLASASLPFVLFVVPETLRAKNVGVFAGESTEDNPR